MREPVTDGQACDDFKAENARLREEYKYAEQKWRDHCEENIGLIAQRDTLLAALRNTPCLMPVETEGNADCGICYVCVKLRPLDAISEVEGEK